MNNTKISPENKNDEGVQKVIKELGLENKQLTTEDMREVFEYMQEIYCIES